MPLMVKRLFVISFKRKFEPFHELYRIITELYMLL